MNRNTYLSSQYSVPSLSLAGSRSKRTAPTKDTTELIRPVQHKSRAQIMDRINRPPIFSAKSIADSKLSVESNVSSGSQYKSSKLITTSETLNLNRNVYLHQIQRNQSNVTFRNPNPPQPPPQPSQLPQKSPSNPHLLRNPQSSQLASFQIQRRLQSKKIDVNKSLFDRRIKKLFQQAEFYDNQLMGMYADNSQVLNQGLKELEKCRKDAMDFDFGTVLLR